CIERKFVEHDIKDVRGLIIANIDSANGIRTKIAGCAQRAFQNPVIPDLNLAGAAIDMQMGLHFVPGPQRNGRPCSIAHPSYIVAITQFVVIADQYTRYWSPTG